MTTRDRSASAEAFAAMAERAGIALEAAEIEELRRGYNILAKWLEMLDRDWHFSDESDLVFTPPEQSRGR
jgi:hypothetical protein